MPILVDHDLTRRRMALNQHARHKGTYPGYYTNLFKALTCVHKNAHQKAMFAGQVPDNQLFDPVGLSMKYFGQQICQGLQQLKTSHLEHDVQRENFGRLCSHAVSSRC